MENKIYVVLIMIIVLGVVFYWALLFHNKFFNFNSKECQIKLKRWETFLKNQSTENLWRLRNKYQNKVIKLRGGLKKSYFLEIIGMIDQEIATRKK